ncbi:Spy/CpxP family protein refolding chaperone [Planktothrix agardhii]|nr:periplasmic heavy metal sensor [Planktothrix agardhii]MCB8759754.1 periplasmic heavy metal sensor [Planktothrix agardhii 1813]
MRLTSRAIVAIFGLSMVALFTSSTPVMAESIAQAAPNQPQMNGRSDRMFSSLNLTPEQQQKIQQIRQEYQGEIRQQQQQIRQLQQELNGLMAKNTPESELRQKHDQFMALKQQMGDIQFNMMLKTREILTAEQRTQLANLRQERRQSPRRDR